uniref:Germanicol synthase n=1 Tax=Rhizophora mucronata TaxID=61149 RepID=A0A2P2MRZ5_RHIMU
MSLQLHWQMEPPTSLLWVFTPATILIILTMEQASDPNSALLNRHRIKMTFPCSKASLNNSSTCKRQRRSPLGLT